MLRNMFEASAGKINDPQFKRIMEMSTEDIKFNRLGFKKMTYLQDILEIASQCAAVDQRIEKDGRLEGQNKIISSHYNKNINKKSIEMGNLVSVGEYACVSYISTVKRILADKFYIYKEFSGIVPRYQGL